jgi:hypothetical protein
VPQIIEFDSEYSEPGFALVGFLNTASPQSTGNSQSTFRYVHVSDMPIHEIVLDTAGDFDESGMLDEVDIDWLNGQIKIGGNHSLFDLNADGLVTDDDRQVWVQDLAGTFLGDANLDFSVDAADLNALASNWRQPIASWAGGDFTGDGLVNTADLNVLALNWRNAAAAPVPEPSSSMGLVLLSLFVLARRRPGGMD